MIKQYWITIHRNKLKIKKKSAGSNFKTNLLYYCLLQKISKESKFKFLNVIFLQEQYIIFYF